VDASPAFATVRRNPNSASRVSHVSRFFETWALQLQKGIREEAGDRAEVHPFSRPKIKRPANQAGLNKLPVGMLSAKHNYYNIGAQLCSHLQLVEGRAEEDGV